jgi:hypothetical protein
MQRLISNLILYLLLSTPVSERALFARSKRFSFVRYKVASLRGRDTYGWMESLPSLSRLSESRLLIVGLLLRELIRLRFRFQSAVNRHKNRSVDS